MKELERTFLAKFLPDLSRCKSKEITDIYIPESRCHPTLRIRKNGNAMEATKKFPVDKNDSSVQNEFTIPLDQEEFSVLSRMPGKSVRKTRYYYAFNNHMAEIDVFQDSLRGLVLVDFEFENEEDKNSFEMPDFCLADVTQEEFIAGGMLCGKSYSDIENELKKFGYAKLSLD